MSKYQILENVVRTNIPSYDKLPQTKRKKILRDFLNKNLEKIVMKVKLPDPIQIKMDVMREKYWDERRRKGHKRGQWKINYNLWSFLFELKSKIKFDLIQNSEYESPILQDRTTTQPLKHGDSSTAYLSESYAEADTYIKPNLKPLVHFSMDSKIEEKITNSHVYEEFVKCLDTACRSSTLKIKNATYYLHESIDMENPKWEKLILDASFDEIGFDEKLEKWDELRDKIDAEISKLKLNSVDKKFLELEKKLYVNVIF